MKRKVFNQTSVPDQRPTGYFIRINPKNGGFVFSRELGDMLNLKQYGVNFIQDEERPSDWYLEKSSDANAFKVRFKKTNSDNRYQQYILQSSFLAREILKSAGLPIDSTRLMVASEPIEKDLYAIITKSANIKKAA